MSSSDLRVCIYNICIYINTMQLPMIFGTILKYLTIRLEYRKPKQKPYSTIVGYMGFGHQLKHNPTVQ